MQEFYWYLAFFLLIDPSYDFLFSEAPSIVLQVLNNPHNNLYSFDVYANPKETAALHWVFLAALWVADIFMSQAH